MIRKTIISAILLFGAYNAFLYWVHPSTGSGQHQWQKNRILIEDYADYHQGAPVVIVGTSLSARLYPSLLPSGYYNLALAGESIFDGLHIVAQSTRKPKAILIETNIFYKAPDEGLDEGIFDPKMIFLRKYLPSFREENQPANLIPPLLGSKANKSENLIQSPKDSGILNALLKQKISDYQQVPDSAIMTKNLLLLKKYITEFEAEGIKVILYEIPVNCKLYQTQRYKIPEERLFQAFPATTYHWMSMPDCGAYVYTDGEHLALQSSVKFVDWFVEEVHQIGVKL